MKSKKFVFLVIGVFILFSLSSIAETKKITRLGQNTLVRIKGEVPTAEVMKILLERYTGDIKYGFDLAGYGDLYIPFVEQIKASSFEEKELAVGDKLMWMLYRSQEQVKVVQDIEWAGKAPLPVFSFTVVKDYKHYEFVMPKPCGNISLRGVKEVIPDAACDIKVNPVKANINDPISVDMSGSHEAKTMEVNVYDPDGTKISMQKLTQDSPKWQTKFNKPGEYTFKAKAFNVKGKPSENPCEAKTYINSPPSCKLWTSCLPCKDYVGRPITFDASGSSDPDGEVTKVSFEIQDETGTAIDTYVSKNKPFTWEKVFDKPGVYSVIAVATDDFNAMSEPCTIEFEVTQRRAFFLVDFGPFLARGSHGAYVAGRLGLFYKIVPDSLSFIISGGGGLALNGDPWKSIFMANALLNVHSGPAYFGAGVGMTTKVKETRDADFELVGNIGVNVFNTYKTQGSIFFEGRGPVGEGRSFSKNHKLMLGFRLIF